MPTPPVPERTPPPPPVPAPTSTTDTSAPPQHQLEERMHQCQHHQHQHERVCCQHMPPPAPPPTSMINTNTTRTSANAASTCATTGAVPTSTTLPSPQSRFQASSAPFILREAHHRMSSFHLRTALLCGILNELVNANTSMNWYKHHHQCHRW